VYPHTPELAHLATQHTETADRRDSPLALSNQEVPMSKVTILDVIKVDIKWIAPPISANLVKTSTMNQHDAIMISGGVSSKRECWAISHGARLYAETRRGRTDPKMETRSESSGQRPWSAVDIVTLR
jgi:hypothetical protein